MGLLTLLVIILVAYTLVKTAGKKAGQQTSDTADAPLTSSAPAAPVSTKPQTMTPPAHTAFMKGLKEYFHSNWAKDGAIYADLDNMPISCFTVQLREDRVIESISLEGQAVPLVNETSYTTLCAADEIPDLTTPVRQQEAFEQLSAYLLSLGTLTRTEDAFYPIRTAQGPENSPSNLSDSVKRKDDEYEALRAQMQSMLDQMAKDKGRKKV